MTQLILALAEPPSPSLDNFVAGRNAAAITALRSLMYAPEAGAVVYLFGERGSGRTHLARAVAEVWRHQGRALSRFVVADDVQALDAEAQGRLFDTFNEMRAAGSAMLVTGDRSPRDLQVREDLRTRLASGLAFQLHALSDAEKIAALLQRARDLGMPLTEAMASYILAHARRDMRTLITVLDAIDRYSLAAKRPITLPLVREALQTLARES
jgi:DnaA family protein